MAMSKKTTDAPAHTPADLAGIAREDARFGIDFLRRRWRRLLLAFVGVLLPLVGFGALAGVVRRRAPVSQRVRFA